MTIRQFCKDNTVSSVSNVRTNTNGYPYMTFLSEKFEGGAQNIYFGKSTAQSVSANQTPRAINLQEFSIITTENEAGEERLKLSNNTDYTNIDDLLS